MDDGNNNITVNEYSPEAPDNNTVVDKKSKKKKMLCAIAVTVALAIVSVCLLEYQSIANFFASLGDKGPTSMYSDRLNSYNFYPTDYDLDVTAFPEYMEMDRSLYYSIGGETIAVDKTSADRYNPAVAFFLTYFDTAIAGDAETYNTFFTDKYYKTAKPYEQFAPQMIYDMNVEQLSQTDNADGTTTYAFNVWYKIYRNDGTFRNDIPSNASKTLYFEVIAGRDGVKIDRITYYK